MTETTNTKCENQILPVKLECQSAKNGPKIWRKSSKAPTQEFLQDP